MDNTLPFIATSDENIAKTLRAAGFQELPKQGGRWMFVNDHKRTFSFEENNKVGYTNKLTF